MRVSRCASIACAAAFVTSLASGFDGNPRPGAPSGAALETGSSESASPEGVSGAPASVTASAARGPTLHPQLLEPVATRLGRGLRLALERLLDRPSCRALFTRLGADGTEKLNGSSYYPAGKKQESRYCRRRGFAVTMVGSSDVVVCRKFGRLTDSRAAIILIHEALHFAGQSEYPIDPRAPDADAITEMVMEGCRLF
jgi:hypothetical protein